MAPFQKLRLIASFTRFAIELRLISIVRLIATLCEMGPWSACKCVNVTQSVQDREDNTCHFSNVSASPTEANTPFTKTSPNYPHKNNADNSIKIAFTNSELPKIIRTLFTSAH